MVILRQKWLPTLIICTENSILYHLNFQVLEENEFLKKEESKKFQVTKPYNQNIGVQTATTEYNLSTDVYKLQTAK